MAEKERSYPLGNRRRNFKGPTARFADERFAWTINNIGQFVIMVNEVDNQAGPMVRLFYPLPGRSYNISWDLTNLTEEELDALKGIIDTAFEWAKPVVQARDKEARDAFEAGDDSQIRIYRAVPQLVYRKSPIEEYGQSVLHGPSHVSGLGDEPEPEGDQPGDVQRSGDDLAERDEGVGESQDDGPQAD